MTMVDTLYDGYYGSREKLAWAFAEILNEEARAIAERLDQAPPLSGADFATNWNDLSLNDLFERIRISGQVAQGMDASPISIEADFFSRQLTPTTFTGALSLPVAGITGRAPAHPWPAMPSCSASR